MCVDTICDERDRHVEKIYASDCTYFANQIGPKKFMQATVLTPRALLRPRVDPQIPSGLINEFCCGIIHGASVQVFHLTNCFFLPSASPKCFNLNLRVHDRFSQPAHPEPVPDLRGPEEKEKEEESIPPDSQPENQDGEEFEIAYSRSQVSDEQIFPTPDLPNVPDIDNTNSHTGPLHESQPTPTPWPQRLILHILFIAVDHVRFSEPGVLFYTEHGGLRLALAGCFLLIRYPIYDGSF